MIMPRNAKDSDDEMEAKSGRRTRAALNPSVLDSPLRRSSRIKQPAQQEGSSPESVSDVSSTGTTRSTKRRTATGDAAVTEATRSLRTRRNSVASDISELTETESLPDGPAKRVTRRSAASVAAVDTPPNLNGRTRRATRAGSESKSTPPVGRTTRRNRASSLEPEAIEEQTVREVGTPVKSRRRASALPSEPAVAEESEESGRGGRRSATTTVYELDEEEPDSPTLDTSMSWRRKSKNANKSAEKVDESPVRKTEDNTMERTTRENTEAGADDSHVPQKHEVSMKGADSSETKQADDGCSPEIVSPSRSSSYTIESLLSPPTEKQEKSPGNKENEILNDSAVLLERSVKLSNRSDVRLSSRNSLGSSYVKPQEKRLNISVDDNLLSNDYETSTKSQQDDNTELAKKSTPKSSRKERYSVDECVVIIEPMEINRIDKIVVNSKEVDTPESPKIPKTYEVVELTSEATEEKELECKLPEKEVENTKNFGGETNLEISNVMSIAMTEKFDEPEPMEVDESPELLYLETNDTSDVNEEEMPNEFVDHQQVSVESSNTKAKSPTLISENKEANDDVVNDDVVNDEETSKEISISDAEPRVLNTEEKTSTEPSVSKDELSILNPEDKALSDGVNDEKVSSEAVSISNDDLRRSLNPEEKAPSESVNNEKTSLEASVSNDEPRRLNSEEQTPSDVLNVEKAEPAAAAEEASNPNIELTASYSSINNEKPINSHQDEVNLLNAKGRKRSIVTETPTNGRANGEGAKNVSEEEKRRKSASNRRASNVSKEEEEEEEEEEKKNGDTEEKLSKKEAEAERKAQQSDEESEYDGYPAFKDIPADEWTATSGADIENTKKNTDIERNSVHSVSTEHNDSECDFQLIDKEYSQGSEKEEQVKSDYDSDDTVKIAVAHENSIEPEDDKEQVNASVASAETPMELSSDEEEIFTTKASNYVSNLNSSLDTCRKINEPKTPTNKNISLIDDTTAKTSSAGLNSSRRKSLLCVDDRSTENSNSPLIKLNSSVKRYSLNASAPSKEDEESDNDGEADVTEHRTPKMFNRKSLEGSAKKIKSPLDSSRTTVSSKNTPSNTAVENRASETSAKRNRSLSKSAATSSQSDGADDSFDNNTRSETTMEDNKSVNLSKHALQIALKNQLKAISPACNLSEVFSNANNSLASPILDKKRFSLNKSERIGSAEKSSKDKNSKSKYEVSSSDSDDGEEESQQEPSSPKIQLNESRKSTSAKKLKINKNKSVIAPSTESPISPELEEQGNQIKSAKFRGAKKISLSSEMDNNEASQDSSISSEAEEKILEKSVKSGSAKKSAKKNTWKLGAIDFDDNKIDYDDLQEELDKSAVNKSKIGSAKKSANHSRTSRISSDSVADDEDSRENSNESSKSASVKKSVIDKNYSTIAQVNSDSDVDVEVESDTTDDDADISRKIPRYLFNYSSESDSHLSPKSIDSDIERDMNLHGKSRLEYSDDDVPGDDCMATESESSDDDDDGVDLIDFLVEDDEDDEEFSDVEQDLGLHDNETNESFSSEEKKPRRRIIPRPAGYSDSDESPEEKPMNISSTLDKSKTPKSTIEAEKLNKTQEILETEVKAVDLNVSAKNIAAKNKNLLIQSSTPKTLARQTLLSDKSNSKEATTPLNKSAKSADSLVNLDVSSSNKLSKSVCETIQTPANLGSSFKLTKTPKTSLSAQEQLQTSLPADLNNTPGKTNLSKVKSIKLSTLNQTVIPPGSESPETRFLMKEKLNDSMPALKLQQRAKALRRSALENLDEEIQTTNQLPEEMDEIAAEKRISLTKEEDASEPKVSSEKKKKKKKKQQQKDASENSEEIATSLTESVTEVNQDSSTSSKKSKKPNKKKKAAVETPEQEEIKHEEIPKKKKKKKQQLEEIIENIVLDEEVDKKERKKKKRVKEIVEHVESNEAEKEKEKKTKKRKERKLIEATEPEVPALRQKSRRIAARNDQDSGSVDDEPETMDFNVARDAALKDLRKVTESIKAAQEAKKKKYQENLYSKQERKDKTRPEVAENFEKFKTSVKRLPDDVLGNLSDVAERPRKKRKVNKEETAAASSKTTFSPFQAKSGNFQVNDGYIPLSSAGGTTQFAVVNLKKAVKHHSKKAVAASTFRERMLARNPRLPVSAYLMYQQKQKLLGKDKPY